MSSESWPVRSKHRKYSPGQANYSPRQAVEWSASLISRAKRLLHLSEFARSTPLRRTLLVTGLFAAFTGALLGFIYLKTKADLTVRSDRLIASQMSVFAQLSPQRRLDAIDEHLKQDPDRVQLDRKSVV